MIESDKIISRFLPLLFLLIGTTILCNGQCSPSLNGIWQYGISRKYTEAVQVPGISGDPSKMAEGESWYKREITLPKGDWSFATLELKGARFLPRVYVNGVLVSEQEGGMAPTFHLLRSKAVKPGKTITLEIALASLKDVPSEDASCIPEADRWRADISSGIWDDVILHFHGDQRITRVAPFYNLKEKTVSIHFDVENCYQNNKGSGICEANVYDTSGKLLLSARGPYHPDFNSLQFSYDGILKEWSPDSPNCYRLKLILKKGNQVINETEHLIGIKEFRVEGKQFYLNGDPCKLRGGSVVWHRWVRSEEGRELGYDTAWFAENIIQRLKEHGANYLRFHLGVPPERLLDLCDKYGLLVQFEWGFFHGMPATKESLLGQLPAWLDVAMKHPCVALYHPYNETEGDQLKIMWDALNQILQDYPPLVLEGRDVMHVHKYWWSLFENLGLYYDDADQFDKAIMVDEFGGNYLDGKGNLGGYLTLKESNLRFLGRSNTAKDRLEMQSLSNGKVAEYWRRIDAAGLAPFCILSSWEDGNTWFMGKLKNGMPKPVWNALTPAFSPLSVSLETWDRNFTPGQTVTVPVYFFNDLGNPANLSCKVIVEDQFRKRYTEKKIQTAVPAYSKIVEKVQITLPEKEGAFKLKAILCNAPERVEYPVVSEWDIRMLKAKIPENLKNVSVAVPDDEKELQAFLAKLLIPVKPIGDPDVHILLTSKITWNKLVKDDPVVRELIEKAIDKGISVVMLDVGKRNLGQGYPAEKGNLGPSQGVKKVADPLVSTYKILNGVSLTFTEAAEPESHLHPAKSDSSLWFNLPRQYTWLWNGMRGGLIVPADYLEVSGLSQAAFLEQWKAREANEDSIRRGNYYAYELQGFYDYSSAPSDQKVKERLVKKVRFLVADAPALAGSINPQAPVTMTDLAEEYQTALKSKAENLTVMANAGKNLTRTPVVAIGFAKGKLIVSQLLTAGRLNENFAEPGLYGIRYDEAAVQMVLNMMSIALKK